MKSLPTSYTRFRKRITILALAAAAACAAVASLCAGSTALPLSQVQAVLSGGGEGTARNIVLYVRLPRTLAALLCGAALAMLICKRRE